MEILLYLTSELREVREANLGNFSRKFPLNRCYVVSLQGERGSEATDSMTQDSV
jgi:hypothetical protein